MSLADATSGCTHARPQLGYGWPQIVEMRVRLMRADDVPGGLRLCRASGWNQVARDWLFFLAHAPEGCMVAGDADDAVIGTSVAMTYADALTWIAMVLVDPAHRGHGLGTRLLHEALSAVPADRACGLDATPAGEGLYRRAGFLVVERLQRMTRAAGALPVPGGGTDDRRVRPMTAGDLPRVVAFDAAANGVDRRPLVEWLATGAPEYAWVCGDEEIEGFVLGRPGHLCEHLGPVLARDEPTARALIRKCLQMYPERRFLVDAPLRDPWVGWLEAQGFAARRPFTRMMRGAVPEGDHAVRFATAGPELS